MAKNYENQNKNCKNAQNSTNKAGKNMTDSHSSSKYSSKNKDTDAYEDEEEISKY